MIINQTLRIRGFQIVWIVVLSVAFVINTAASPSGTDFAKMFGLVYNTKYTGAIIDK